MKYEILAKGNEQILVTANGFYQNCLRIETFSRKPVDSGYSLVIKPSSDNSIVLNTETE